MCSIYQLFYGVWMLTVLTACQYVFSSVSCALSFLSSLSLVTKCLYKINARQTFLCVVIYFFKKLNHSPPHPFIFCPHPPTPPPFPFPIAVQSDPPLAQSWPITPHRNQGVGWRRWQVSEGPLTRYRFDRHPSWSITRSWGVKVTGLLLLTWAGYYSRLQAPEKWLFSAAKD